MRVTHPPTHILSVRLPCLFADVMREQIGQLASTRADFLPPQYYDRVKMLQSDTPAEPLDYIRYIYLRHENGK